MRKLLILFLTCLSLSLFSQVPVRKRVDAPPEPTFAERKMFRINYPVLSELERDVEYIVIDDDYSFVRGACTTDNTNFDPCKENTPSCDIDLRPECASQTWTSLVLQHPAYTGNTLRYVLIKPGEYRPLGRLYINTESAPSVNKIYFMYWDSVGNSFDPPNDSSAAKQVIMEGIYFNNADNFVFHGLVFDGVGLRYNTDSVGFTSIFDQDSDGNIINKCLFQNTATIGIRIRNSNNNIIQDSEFRNPANLCGDPPGIYIHSSFDSADYNMVLNNLIYNWSDGIQVGDIAPEGVSTKGTIIAGNRIFMDTSKIYLKLGLQRMLAENAIDLKLGGNGANHMIVRDNIMHTYRPTPDTVGCGLGSLGKVASIHFDCHYLDFFNNYLYDGVIGIALASTLNAHNYYNNTIADIFFGAGTAQPGQEGGAFLTANTMDSVWIYNNIFVNTDSCIRFVGNWQAVDTVAQKIFNNVHSSPNVLQFEGGTRIEPFSSQVDGRNIQNISVSTFKPSLINQTLYPIMRRTKHKMVNYVYD